METFFKWYNFTSSWILILYGVLVFLLNIVVFRLIALY